MLVSTHGISQLNISVVLTTVLIFKEIPTVMGNFIFISLFLVFLAMIVYGSFIAQEESEFIHKRTLISLKHI
jgi:hypothetical protein